MFNFQWYCAHFKHKNRTPDRKKIKTNVSSIGHPYKTRGIYNEVQISREKPNT